MAQAERPPLDPESAVALVWGLSLELSSDSKKQEISKHSREKIAKLFEDRKELNVIQYMNELLFEITSTLRSLSYRREGFQRQMDLNNAIQVDEIKLYNALMGVSLRDAKSLVPRLSFTLGGISLSDAISNIINSYLPLMGKVSGLEIFLVGGVVGYFIAEIVLRIYGHYMISKVKKNAHFNTHIAWNRFIIESREVMRNFIIEAIRLREKLFPKIGTLGTNKAFLGMIDENTKQSIEIVIDDIIERHLPILHHDIKLSCILFFRKNYFSQCYPLKSGDAFLFSYSVLDGKSVNCHFFDEDEYNSWVKDKSSKNTMYTQCELCQAGDTIYISKTRKYYLVFENPSYVNSRIVTFGCQILHDLSRTFCL